MLKPEINTVGARFPDLEWLVLAEAKDNDIASTILDPNGEGILVTEKLVKAFKCRSADTGNDSPSLSDGEGMSVHADDTTSCATIENPEVPPVREKRKTASSNLMTHIMGFHRSASDDDNNDDINALEPPSKYTVATIVQEDMA
ncbi:hypothetical protein FVEN_g3669 [Fusarium venenatum]|nr:hypothetical protein FVEN_g3669 [Fusarium venenatum]